MGGWRIGCIGLGRMVRIFCGHLSGRLPEANLAAVADVAPGLAERTAAEFAVPHWYAEYNDLVTRAPVDAVIIATPASTHVDLGRWLMGSEVPRVTSEGGTLVFQELNIVGDFGNAVINLKFANGTPGNVEVSRNALYGYDIRTEVLGSDGAVLIGGLQQTPVLLLTRDGGHHDVVTYIVERFGDAYLAELRDFVLMAQGKAEPAPSIYD